MGSSSTQEWLELSLGLRCTEKEQQRQKEEKEDEKRSRPYQKKLVVCGTTSHEESEYVNLDLRLQIGPNNKSNYYNMGIRDFMLQHQSKKKHFHSDYSSITNSAGLWFSLLSSPNRKGGAALPQIPKPYIRVKDEKMTVLMVKKYLLTKLGLSNQAEVELWCMGERLFHTQSLKQVRDGIWLPKLVEFVNSSSSSLSSSSILFHPQNHPQNQTPFSSSNTYLMSLHYGRASFF